MSLLLLFQGGNVVQGPVVPTTPVLSYMRVNLPRSYGGSRRSPYTGTKVIWNIDFVPVQGGQVFTQTVDDLLDVVDDYFRVMGSNQADSLAAQDAVTKVLSVVMGDAVLASDLFEKLLGANFADQVTLSDVMTVVRSAVFGDALSVLDDYFRLQGANLDDSGVVQDAIVKTLSKVLADQVTLDDAATLSKFAALSFTDLLDVVDDYFRSQSANIDDAVRGQDAIEKLLSKNIDERQDVTDTADIQKVAGLLLLEVLDFVDLVDEFTKKLTVSMGEPQALLDGSSVLIGKTATDTVAVSDTATLDKYLILVLGDIQDVADGFTRIQSANMDESASASDEFTKVVSKTLSDLLDARDDLQKALAATLTERQDVADAIAFVRVLTALVQDLLDVADDMTRSAKANIDDSAGAVDALTKAILANINDRLDLVDSVVTEKFLSLVLSEVQDVADDMVRALAVVMEDSTVGQDALTKLIMKVADERQDVSDDALVEFIPAIIIIAEYLDTRLGARHDLVNRLGGINGLTNRVSKLLTAGPRASTAPDGRITKIKDTLARKPGTRGHKR